MELEKSQEGIERLARVAARWGIDDGQNSHTKRRSSSLAGGLPSGAAGTSHSTNVEAGVGQASASHSANAEADTGPTGGETEKESDEGMEEEPREENMGEETPQATSDSGEDGSMSYLGLLEQVGLPDTYVGNTEVIEQLLQVTKELGGNVQDNVDLCIARCRVLLSEIYNLSLVARAAELLTHLNIDPGLAMDLTTTDEEGRPLDFSREDMKTKARARVRRDKPDLLIGSPMCTLASAWQRLNRDINAFQRRLKDARAHLEFFCYL